jgi:antitoxin component of RelBE/YafQ-DinJ toxin-antitoxin module
MGKVDKLYFFYYNVVKMTSEVFKMSKEIKRVGIRLNQKVYDKLQEIADNYGMTVNSLMAYVLGQWVDTTYGLKDKVTKRMLDVMSKMIVQEQENSFNVETIRQYKG